jgi:hypothetical protein
MDFGIYSLEKPTNNAIPSATPLSKYSTIGCARGLWGG